MPEWLLPGVRACGTAGVSLAVFLGDGLLKRIAEQRLADGRTLRLAGGHIHIRLFHNPGVALGALKKHPRAVLFINGGLLCAVAGAFAALIRHPKSAAAKLGLALMLGGGGSNFWDRLRRGYVTDYVSFDFGKRFARLSRIVFNCSDFGVFLGAALFGGWYSLRGK